MANLLWLLLRHPFRSLLFAHTFFSQILLVLLRRALLPHLPVYQSLRIQIQRAYLSAASCIYPELTHRLPVGNVPPSRARKIRHHVPAYLIPGKKQICDFAGPTDGKRRCVVLYAHGGGYARGEARMYLNYMERWVRVAALASLDLVFLSVEYPLSTEESHPAQRDSFLQAYRYLLDNDIRPQNVVFMGDSAGGGLSILSGLELTRLNLPQPAATILISPWMDMTLKSSQGGNAAVESDYFIMANRTLSQLVSLFIKDHPPDSPEVNPLYSQPEECAKLSPQLILVGAAEFALYDSKQWADFCTRAGLQHKLVVEWGQLHIYAMGSNFTDPDVRRKTDAMIVEWILQHVS